VRGCAFTLACALSLSACPKDDGKPPPPPRDAPLGVHRCTAQAGKKNVRKAIFQKPFDGDFPVYNLFDHETPGDFKPYSAGSNELSYCGIDMLGLSEGFEGYAWGLPLSTPIMAVADGEVVHAGNDDEFFCLLPEFRRQVSDQLSVHVKHVLKDKTELITIYQHLSKVEVKLGDKIEAGEELGRSGRTGCATEPLFYFGVLRLNGTKTGKPVSIDPYGWDSARADPWADHPKGAQSYYLWEDGEAPRLEGRVKP
jgi:murein DD-endopeptidase MepM/ murein hydrolase activator NlpD